ncbi:uncharacterized protein LOC143895323 [Temnothorax americanus]|uniref:uncharacterized protein LOC143895323 n=1 Tax=Temnothorax americanus TaxID=1964332 RepID=UPI004068BCF1
MKEMRRQMERLEKRQRQSEKSEGQDETEERGSDESSERWETEEAREYSDGALRGKRAVDEEEESDVEGWNDGGWGESWWKEVEREEENKKEKRKRKEEVKSKEVRKSDDGPNKREEDREYKERNEAKRYKNEREARSKEEESKHEKEKARRIAEDIEEDVRRRREKKEREKELKAEKENREKEQRKKKRIILPTLDHHQAVSPLMEKNSTNVESFSESTLSIKNSKELIIPNQGVQGGSDESHKGNDPTKIMISFGSKSLSLATVQKARHSKLSVLAAELCGLVFTIRELALCSLKGKKTNAHKNAFQKQPIDQEKVKEIIDYIAKYFAKSPDDIKDDVYKAIGNKLNNFSKISEGKKIINEYVAEKAQQQNGQQQQQQVDEQQVEINPQQVAVKTEPQEQAVQQYDEQQLIENQKTDVINTSNQKTDNAPLLLQLAALNKVANPDQQEAL